ncbi:MAG: hypothetical protein ACKOYJ_06170 [Planctomycetia bacterium]
MTTNPTPAPRNAEKVLSEEFFLVRAKILDIAAMLDRLERAEGSVDDHARRALLRRAMEILLDDQGDKASRVQLLMSRPYDPDWRRTYGLR